jgi:hypothetical protein
MSLNPEESKTLSEIKDTIGRMDTKLFDEQTGFIPATQATHEKYGKRIGRLEKWAFIATGAGLAVGWLITHHLMSIAK